MARGVKRRKKRGTDDSPCKVSVKVTDTGPSVASRRTRRRGNSTSRRKGSSSTSYQAPSASHYIGYVEDGETVEMIMRKFEILQQIEEKQKQSTKQQQQQPHETTDKNDLDITKKNSSSDENVSTENISQTQPSKDSSSITTTDSTTENNNGTLSEEALQELFNKTSNFTVHSAMESHRKDENAFIEYDNDLYDQNLEWQNAAELLRLDENGEVRELNDTGNLYWDGSGNADDFWTDMFGTKGKWGADGRWRPHGSKSRKHSSDGVRYAQWSRLIGGKGQNVRQVAFVQDRNGKYIAAVAGQMAHDPESLQYIKIPLLPKEKRFATNAGCLAPRSWAIPVQWFKPKSLNSKKSLNSNDDESQSSSRTGSILSASHSTDDSMTNKEPSWPSLYNEVPSILNLSIKELSCKQKFNKDWYYQGIVMDPPWQSQKSYAKDGRKPGHVVPSDISNKKCKLFNSLRSTSLCPCGFLFVWVNKAVMHDVLLEFEKINFCYVENACWVLQRLNDSIACLGGPQMNPSNFACTSHLTLLVLRRCTWKINDKGERVAPIWEQVHIRHQRTEDVVFDVARLGKNDVSSNGPSRLVKPAHFVYRMVETMLPYCKYEKVILTEAEKKKLMEKEANGEKQYKLETKPGQAAYSTSNLRKLERGRLLELWAQPGETREGWTSFAQKPVSR
eukprot:g1221.t1